MIIKTSITLLVTSGKAGTSLDNELNFRCTRLAQLSRWTLFTPKDECKPLLSKVNQCVSVTNYILLHAEVGRFGPFCIRGVWSLLYLWCVAMALASFWLYLVFVSEVLVSSAIRNPECRRTQRPALKIATHDI